MIAMLMVAVFAGASLIPCDARMSIENTGDERVLSNHAVGVAETDAHAHYDAAGGGSGHSAHAPAERPSPQDHATHQNSLALTRPCPCGCDKNLIATPPVSEPALLQAATTLLTPRPPEYSPTAKPELPVSPPGDLDHVPKTLIS